MGVNLQPQDEFEVLQQVPIAVVMDRSYLALPASMSLLQAGKTMLQDKCHTALVLDETEQLIGLVTLADIRRALVQAASELSQTDGITQTLKDKTLRDICTAEVLYAYENEPVSEALERMGARGLYLLPVVARDNPRKVLGVIEKHRIALASNLAMTEAALHPYLSKV